MSGLAVVALAIVFHHKLPVAVFDDFLLEGNLGVLQVIWCKTRSHRFFQLCDVLRRVLTEAYENVRSDNPRMHWNQATAGRGEVLPHVGCVAQASVEVVRPLMIRTYQHADRRLPSLFQTCATMAT